ncbi:hypothetical protein BJP34_20705 [Moorena producens PAL-8-15-08-1]|uniref:Uncharacterized protein n=2 Tax=Moorena TaxID=1155738 RepID=A0A1D8TV53_9CYAN|nr:hypothetical protein BJP34_20705 [Moorena producens PAL-8-15-08-1]
MVEQASFSVYSARQEAKGKSQKFTTTAFAACINVLALMCSAIYRWQKPLYQGRHEIGVGWGSCLPGNIDNRQDARATKIFHQDGRSIHWVKQ